MKKIILLASIATVLLCSCANQEVKITRMTSGVSYKVSADGWHRLNNASELPLKKGDVVVYAGDVFTVDSL